MSDSINSHLLRATQRILRPLVRILLRNGITAPAFQELARKVFVDVAHNEFALQDKPQTLARVSVITGLNRKEVARLHRLEGISETDRSWWNRAGTVLAGWLTDPNYHTRAGFPVDLPFNGPSPNFSELVRQYSGDMYPRSVADELLRLGAIETVDGLLRLSNRGYAPDADPAAMIDILGMDTAELMETIDHNIQVTADDKLLQAKVLADNLPAEHLAAFNQYSKRLAMQNFDDLIRWLNAHDAGKDNSGSDARFAVGLGIYQINRQVRKAHHSDEGEKA